LWYAHHHLPGKLSPAHSSSCYKWKFLLTHKFKSIFAQAATASTSSIAPAQANLLRSPDLSIASIGDPSNLNYFLPDLWSNPTHDPRLANLQDMVGGQKSGVEVANGHVIKCSSTGTILIAMQYDNGIPFQTTLQDIMNVPGLSRRLFSLTKFAKHGHHALVKNNATIIYFGGAGTTRHPVTLMTGNKNSCIRHHHTARYLQPYSTTHSSPF
jgi:hypothetical protein